MRYLGNQYQATVNREPRICGGQACAVHGCIAEACGVDGCIADLCTIDICPADLTR